MHEPVNIDLHCHSDQSDGSLSPQALVARAHTQGVEMLSITDHDTVSAYSLLRAQPYKQSLHIIAGAEFSTIWNGIGVHIVGLNLDLSAASLVAGIRFQKDARRKRARSIAERLVKRGAPGSTMSLAETHAGNSIGRPHFADHLVQTGYVKNLNEAYRKYLGPGKPGDVNTFWATPEQILSWIHDARGLAVLAHPAKYKMSRSKLRRLLKDFRCSGGDAMEVISGRQNHTTTREMALLSTSFDLLASVGSDFHRPGMSWNELGCCAELPSNCTPVWSRFSP